MHYQKIDFHLKAPTKKTAVHPVHISGSVEKAEIQFIVRDHITANLKKHEDELEGIAKSIVEQYPNCTYTFVVKEQYRNMKRSAGSAS
jgi:tripeptide aminopeptidase